MGPLLLLLVAAVATLATAPCSSDHAGDAAEDSCDTWCSAADHVYDCTFCSCRACGFCYASNPHAKAQRQLPIDPELCADGGTVEVMQRDDRGFRLEVVPTTWKVCHCRHHLLHHRSTTHHPPPTTFFGVSENPHGTFLLGKLIRVLNNIN